MNNEMLKVLLVDDEENIRNLVRACIDWNEIGYEISCEASSGLEALDVLEEFHPDIIITDIRMPFMDGLEFAAIAVERYPYVKIIVLTAYEEFEYAKKGIKIGIADFLLKPVKRADLRNSLIDLKKKIELERISKDEINEIGFYIKAGIFDKAVVVIDRILNDSIAARKNNNEQLRVLAVNIVTVVLNSITELGLSYEGIFESKSLSYSQVLKIDTIPEMKEYLDGLVSNAVNLIKSARTKKSNKILNDIITFIDANISDPGLSLASLAKTFYLNSSYLCRVFKQETGQTFVEYLTRVRIEMGISLVKETDLRAYEIGDKVGIPDPNYFGKCFKKYTGMSVNDFKKI